MSPTKISELKSDIEELNKLISVASRPKVKDILALEVRKIETELIRLEENNSVKYQPPVSSSNVPNSAAQRSFDVKLSNYAWDQSDKFVKLYITLKNVQSLKPESVKCTFTKRSVELKVNELDNRNYILTINNLSNDLNESNCYWKVKTDMVVVFLSKEDTSKRWGTLTVTEKKDALSESADKKKDLDMDTDPANDLMGLMQKMYNDGDDEMKRAIAKAWCEGRSKGMGD